MRTSGRSWVHLRAVPILIDLLFDDPHHQISHCYLITISDPRTKKSKAHLGLYSHDGPNLPTNACPLHLPRGFSPSNQAGRTMPIPSRWSMPHPRRNTISIDAHSTTRALSTFHERNDSRSMIVVWTISFPGKTPHVTAFLPSWGTLLLHSPFSTIHQQPASDIEETSRTSLLQAK